ncbi:MAG: hypothetical protein ABFR89_11025 [Actinomycetota bacterium]
MKIGRSVNVIRAGLVWRTVGSSGAGSTLLEAMSGADEQERMLAGMSLVKAGERSIGLIEEAYESGRATAPVVRLLPDLDGPQARELLARIAREPGALGVAATDALELLDRIDALGDNGQS